VSGFVYQLSYPQIVNGRNQYNLEITLPTAIDAEAVQGPMRDVIEFVKRTRTARVAHRQENGSSRKVDLEFLPIADSKLGTISLHLEDWKVRAITVEQYVSK
jgi:hypothetical protein